MSHDDDSGEYERPSMLRRSSDRGTHSERLGAHGEAIRTLQREVHGLRKDIGEIKDIVSGVKGGWRTVVAFGTVTGAAGGLIFKLLSMIKGGG